MRLQDRPWNDPGPRRGQAAISSDVASRPLLRAIVLDFSAVNYIDVTSAQALVDLRDQFDRYASPNKVEWHFAGIGNRWTKRALVASGFGYGAPATEEGSDGSDISKPEPLVAVAQVDSRVDTRDNSETESGSGKGISPVVTTVAVGADSRKGSFVPVSGLNRPYFHVNLATAVESAVRSVS